MESYTEILRDYLQERRNVSKEVFKIMNSAYRAVQKGRMTWNDVIRTLDK